MSQILYPQDLDQLRRLLEAYEGNTLWVMDRNTHLHCKPIMEEKMVQKIMPEYQIPPGEKSKSWAELEALVTSLEENEMDRHSLIVNLGGGVVSDLGGFAAAVFKRGINYINIPTSLLAMCDAAIGGKTAINGIAKNQIGAFHKPTAVYIDSDFLSTLPASEKKSGLVELLKTRNLEYEKVLISELEENLKTKIKQAAEYKKKICDEDPKENGARIFLNIGHTLGHALEAWSQTATTPLSHGEAVLLGLYYEHLYLDSDDWSKYYHEIIQQSYDYLETLKLPPAKKLKQFLLGDKKSKNALIQIPYLSGNSQKIAEVNPDNFLEYLDSIWLK